MTGSNPLNFRLVAAPPRRCRSALLTSSTSLTALYRLLLYSGSRSAISLCTGVANQNVLVKTYIAQKP